MSTPKIKPIGERVLVQLVNEKEQIKGGIFIPDSAKEKPTEAKVIALGTGRIDDNGKKVPFDVAVGDTILISKYGGMEVKYEGEDYKILTMNDILAIIGK